MTSVASFQRITYGKLYYNSFASADGTTKTDELGAPSWSIVAGTLQESALNAIGNAAVTAGQPNMLVCASGKYSADNNLERLGVVARLTDLNNSYRLKIDDSTGPSTITIEKRVGGAMTTIATTTLITAVATYYDMAFAIVGSQLNGWITDGTTIVTLAVGDSALATGNFGGVHVKNAGSANTFNFNWLVISKSPFITVTGLLEGQKFKIFKSGIVVGTSGAAAGGIATLDLTSSGVTAILPYDSIQLTDTDGATILAEGTYSASADIWGGDIYQAVVSSFIVSNFPPIAPLTWTSPKVWIVTDAGKVYQNVLGGEISPSSANSLGSFRLIVPDLTGEAELDFPKHKLTWVTIYGQLGYKNGVIMKGFVDQPMPVKMSRNVKALQIAGRSRGAYLALRGFTTNSSYSSTTPDAVVKDWASKVPELQFGNQILSSSVSLSNWTGFGARKYWDAGVELAILASLPNEPWGIWDCVLPDTHVPLESGEWKNIADLNVGDSLLGLEPTKVKYNFLSYHYPFGGLGRGRVWSGNVVVVKPRLLPATKLTPNHPVRVRTYNEHFGKIEWVKASDLDAKKHWLMVPRLSRPRVNNVDLDMATLWGWYVAEGCHSEYRIEFTLGHDEWGFARKIARIIERKYGITSTIASVPTGIKVRACSKRLSEDLAKICGKGARGKKIPKAIFTADRLAVERFLRALCRGDGYRQYGNSYLTTVSPHLMRGLITLLGRFGLIPSVTERQPPDVPTIQGRRVNQSLSYQIGIPTCFLQHRRSPEKSPRKHNYLVYKKYFLLRLREVREEFYAGMVYNIATDSQTYGVPFLTHNCVQEHLGESNVNVHFGPVKREASTIPIVEAYSNKIMAPKDFRQLVTYVRIAYDTGTGTTPWGYYTLSAFGPPAESAYSASFNGTSSKIRCFASLSLDVGESVFRRVAGNDKTKWASGSTIAAIVANTPIIGNVLVAALDIDSSSGTPSVSSISQTGVTWSLGIAKAVAGGHAVEIWYGLVSSSAGTTATVTLTGGTITGGTVNICEYKYSGTLLVDKTASNTGTSTTPDTGTTATTTAANELWVGVTGNYNTSQSTPTNGFTLLDGAYAGSSSCAYLEKIAVTTGTANSGTTLGSSREWFGAIATFKAIPSFTFLTWMQPAGAATQPIFTYDTGAAVGLNLQQAPTFADLQLNLVPTSGTTQTVTKTGQFVAGTSARVAVSYDGTYARLFVNGSKVAEAYAPNLTLQTTYDLYIGHRATATATYYNGLMDNVELLPYAMAETEILEDYQGLRKRGGSILDLGFEEGSGNLTNDRSGCGNRAWLTNITWTANSQVPNSQARFGVIPFYTERVYAGLNEATALAKSILRQLGDPVRFVQVEIPLDMRYNDGQMVDVLIPGIRGRAMLQNVTHYPDPAYYRTQAVLVYQAV